eukprot:CAMPEP_0183359172 /NCGR_PEP_ID=MMETSP0164_2-20130417/51376_1 /TAXON_ID=221442 /ORGANISM="Coccolithus pelagicus ssp braarudi, Strain PLY182g" /LENGTH=101 /DNA_ID=CAMNT_0025533233 /DNA_START=258 /DNA_END=560 /DNA_ORIENTATION=+
MRSPIDTKKKEIGRDKHQKFWKGNQHFELIFGCRRQPGGVRALLPSCLYYLGEHKLELRSTLRASIASNAIVACAAESTSAIASTSTGRKASAKLCNPSLP